jgi:DNA-binding transcriptional regulator YhcF (GntR family)
MTIWGATVTIPFKLDLKSGVPFYRQIIDQVKSAIVTGAITPGDRLPTVRQLAVDLSINPNTVSRAYMELELTGLVDTQMGSGTSITLAGLAAPCLQIAFQWERAVLLRLGKFRALRGSGVFFIIPVFDKVANYVDQRIRVTDFRAETTLTKDTVPVNVDAIAFWMVWDAEKCVLEVSNFDEAVAFSAQTALRDAIGKHELGEMLSQRDKLGLEIQKVLEAKTSSWGITVQSVEIKDIIIPKALEDAMSRKAQLESLFRTATTMGCQVASTALSLFLHLRNRTVLRQR